MLSAVHVRNFKCIRNLDLEFTYDLRKAPKGYRQMQVLPFVEKIGRRFVPCMALYGANASGKSTVLEAIAAIANIALERIHPLRVYKPYMFAKEVAGSTSLEMTWTNEEESFSYGIEVAANRIVGEKLSAGDEIIFSSYEGNIEFQKHLQTQQVRDGLRLQCIDASSGRQLRAIFPVLVSAFPGFDGVVNRAFRSMATQFLYPGRFVDALEAIRALAATFDLPGTAEREQSALDLISSFLRKLDVCIERIEMQKTSGSVAPLSSLVAAPVLVQSPVSSGFNPSLMHDKIEFRTFHLSEGGIQIPMRMQDESMGTRRLFGLLSILLTALRVGGTALVDGMDESLHPALIPELIKLFQVREYNDKHAQLIFTIHNTDLLASGRLSVSEVAFVSQNGYAGTCIRRLSSFSEKHHGRSWKKDYTAGVYDAVPSPYI